MDTSYTSFAASPSSSRIKKVLLLSVALNFALVAGLCAYYGTNAALEGGMVAGRTAQVGMRNALSRAGRLAVRSAVVDAPNFVTTKSQEVSDVHAIIF